MGTALDGGLKLKPCVLFVSDRTELPSHPLMVSLCGVCGGCVVAAAAAGAEGDVDSWRMEIFPI